MQGGEKQAEIWGERTRPRAGDKQIGSGRGGAEIVQIVTKARRTRKKIDLEDRTPSGIRLGAADGDRGKQFRRRRGKGTIRAAKCYPQYVEKGRRSQGGGKGKEGRRASNRP